MSCINKQLSINRLSINRKLLPMDVVNIIKDYCFPSDKFIHKKRMAEIIERINDCLYSRNKSFIPNTMFSVRDMLCGNVEHEYTIPYDCESRILRVCLTVGKDINDGFGGEKTIEVDTCIKCGNYISSICWYKQICREMYREEGCWEKLWDGDEDDPLCEIEADRRLEIQMPKIIRCSCQE